MSSRHSTFSDLLLANNIPITGVDRQGGSTRIHFAPNATAAQKTQAQSLDSTFDWRPYRKRPRSSVLTDLQTWWSTATGSQRDTFLLRAVVAGLPNALKAVNIDDEEPE